MVRLLLSCVALLLCAQSVSTSGLFELRVDSFSSPRGVCDSSDSRNCHVFFRICLKHSQDIINPEPPCTYGTQLTDILNVNSVSGNALIQIPFQFKWPGTFSLIMEAWQTESTQTESTENQNNLITRLATGRTLSVRQEWSQDVHYGDNSELHYSYHVVCSEFYHGKACAAYCRPRNDTFGHYTCDEDGARQCLEGWDGEYCSHPICAPGCSETHGGCKAPGECVCQQGWQGERCDECTRHPGCVHGTCSQPWQCNCKEGWGGLYCDQDLNYCTNHKPCQNDATCTNTGQGSYTCTCKPGFTGTNCEIETNECDSNPCKNGGSCSDLVNDYTCTCPQGFYGKNCKISAMTCADGPCFNGGTCMENAAGGGYSCRCLPGFTGSNCEKKLDRCSSSPCANGAQCLDVGDRFVCRCRPGFSGSSCETNIDDCSSNPCKNAGTCVDGVNDYTCSCTLGFAGKDCSVRDSPCSNFPCVNGGTCYAHFSGPICQCPAGYMGARCEFQLQITKETPTAAPPTPIIMVAFALGFVTLALLMSAAVFILRQVRKGSRLAASTSVKNDLETVNNRNAVVGGGTPNNGSSNLKEKEAFLIPGPHLKVSNKNAALEKGGDNTAIYKNKMADCNLAKDDKNKFDFKKREPTIIVPPLSFGKENLYHPIYIIPDQLDQCVIATEV